jgi:hypothetical protein
MIYAYIRTEALPRSFEDLQEATGAIVAGLSLLLCIPEGGSPASAMTAQEPGFSGLPL